MGARLITDAGRMVGGRPGIVNGGSSQAGRSNINSFNQNFRMEVLYDNGASTPTPNLLATECWIDGTGLYRLGLNIGPTVQNTGATPFALYALAGVPKDLVNQVATDASIVTRLTPLWETLNAAMAVGDVWRADGGVYTIFRVVFTAGDYGSATFISL